MAWGQSQISYFRKTFFHPRNSNILMTPWVRLICFLSKEELSKMRRLGKKKTRLDIFYCISEKRPSKRAGYLRTIPRLLRLRLNVSYHNSSCCCSTSSAPLHKTAVSAFRISCKLLSFTFKKIPEQNTRLSMLFHN